MRKRLEVIAAILPVSLDPEGSFADHLGTIEYKVYEQKCKVDFNQKLGKLEREFDHLEDYSDLFMLDSNDTLFPVNYESPSSSDKDKCTHKDKKHKIYNICRCTYLFFAFALLLGPLQSMMWERCKGLGSTFIDLTNHLETYWTSLYLPLLAPMSWMIAGYLACYLSRPKQCLPLSWLLLMSHVTFVETPKVCTGHRERRRSLRVNRIVRLMFLDWEIYQAEGKVCQAESIQASDKQGECQELSCGNQLTIFRKDLQTKTETQ